jgi:hypothetical protein
MANPEHLAILEKGAEAWNKWREKNPNIWLDLDGASLAPIDLRGVNLGSAHLDGAHLHWAKLDGANLTWAHLNKAELVGASLVGANLANAELANANLGGAKLGGANLAEANLIGTILNSADLSGANLEYADAAFGQFCQCNLTDATLTGVKLYATVRDDWNIRGVKCKYVFWGVAPHTSRSPKGRDFALGEFEQIYRNLPTLEYIFEHGMSPLDPLIMDRVVQTIREQNPEFDLKIDSISARGLAPSIKFTVQQEEYRESALQLVVAGYESRLQRIEAEKDRLYELLGRAIDKAGTRLIEAGPGAVVAMDNACINIEQHVHYAVELQKAIIEQPEDGPTFAKVAKKTALDIIGGALKDVAKGQVKKAAEQVIELGKDLGPVIVNTAAYGFFRGCLR